MMTEESAVEKFKKDGVYIQRGAFKGAELERLRELAKGIQEKTRENLYKGTRYWFGSSKNDLSRPRSEQAMGTWGVNEITRPELFEPELVNVFAHPAVDGFLNAAIDRPRAWGIKMLWTPKVIGYDLGWHRDQMGPDLYDFAHTKPEAQDHIQFNAALNDDECFLAVPGSHRRPLTNVEWDALHDEKTAELPDQEVMRLEPGDILYMDAHALHRGRCAVEGDRLTLHYSVQAQWVPLKPWGEQEHFEWIQSSEFMDQLEPAARPFYERLKTAERTEDAMGFLKECATQNGWVPEQRAA